MSPEEVADWLGVSPLPDGVRVKEVITRHMADVQVPGTDEEHVAAFRAFLACAGRPGGVLEAVGTAPPQAITQDWRARIAADPNPERLQGAHDGQ